MSERVQISVALAVIVLSLALFALSHRGEEPAVEAAVATPAPAPTPDRQALRAAEAVDAEANRQLQEGFARARGANDWQAALDVAERGIERFPDPSSERGGYWLKQRNHISRLLGAGSE